MKSECLIIAIIIVDGLNAKGIYSRKNTKGHKCHFGFTDLQHIIYMTQQIFVFFGNDAYRLAYFVLVSSIVKMLVKFLFRIIEKLAECGKIIAFNTFCLKAWV